MLTGQTNLLLGYPRDARLLIINADDFGMYPANNAGILRAFEAGLVRSTSLMTNCPGSAQAIGLLKEHPEIPFGIHLTLIRDYQAHPWAPLSPWRLVPSLVDESGNCYTYDCQDEFLKVARLDELEVEYRAQIESALSAGLQLTHLDWHCLASGGRADVFDMTLGLAKEYGLALRADEPRAIEKLQGLGLPTNDYPLLDSFRIDTESKPARFRQLLHDLPSGLSVWAVHPALGTAQAQSLDPWGWRIRSADLDFMTSSAAQEAIRGEGIVLLNYKTLQEAWRGK